MDRFYNSKVIRFLSSRRSTSGEGSQPAEQELGNHDLVRTHSDDLSFSKPSTINVVLFGETGVGKSSIVNLIAQNEVAASSDFGSCTMQSTRYNIPFDGLNFAIFDTIGLEEPEFRVNGYLRAIEKAYELTTKLSAAGGVHLLLFCMRGGRITGTTLSNYRLFVEYLCSMKVPVALVFTGLERDKEMEDFWRRNRDHIENYGIKSDGHACITAWKDDDPGQDLKFTESQAMIRKLLKDCALKNYAFTLETESWFVRLGKGMRSFIQKHRSPRKEDILKVLTRRCKLDHDTANNIARMMDYPNDLSAQYLKTAPMVQEAIKDTIRDTPSILIDITTGRLCNTVQKVAAFERLPIFRELLATRDQLDHPRIQREVKMFYQNTMFLHGDQVIKLDPSSYEDYQRKHTALHNAGRHKEAFEAFETMLSLLDKSRDPQMLNLRSRYLDITPMIREAIKDTIRDTPSVLIDVTTGGLCDKAQQAATFELLPIFHELRSSMVIRDQLDYPRIQREVKIFYQSTMFLHGDQVIKLDPSSYEDYQRKHAALHSAGRHKEAFEAFETMLSLLNGSCDPQILNLRSRYLDTTPMIREVIKDTIRDTPGVLIDITTGRLCDKALQAAAFEKLPIFNELRSSMIARDQLDYTRIQKEVQTFYRYAMFSHRWQPDEPTFQMVENISIHQLPDSLANKKLIKFCHLVAHHHFWWAWSDTCCVNQADNRVQQESVIAMFRWYRGSSLTIVHLLGVLSESQKPDSLWKSIWNTRGWTYQEYVASKVVQFYTEDWKPYLNLKIFNHKESSDILLEMQQATKFATQDLNMLQPGLDRVREKLYLASKRQTTREEDIAYSLFGIFNVAIPVMYGEGNQAVGRLLEHILTRSTNVTILAWTGMPGSHHSYLPSDLTVYDQISPPHVPIPVEIGNIDNKITALWSFLSGQSLATTLYEQLDKLPPLSLIAGRLKLSGLVFPLTDPIHVLERRHDSKSIAHAYRAKTPVLGDVLIQTADDLSRMRNLILIHPWITPLLDADFSEDSPEYDLATRAQRLVVRLRQPFGALLLTSRGREPYRRVATDSFIKTQVRSMVTVKELIDSIRTVDIQ